MCSHQKWDGQSPNHLVGNWASWPHCWCIYLPANAASWKSYHWWFSSWLMRPPSDESWQVLLATGFQHHLEHGPWGWKFCCKKQISAVVPALLDHIFSKCCIHSHIGDDSGLLLQTSIWSVHRSSGQYTLLWMLAKSCIAWFKPYKWWDVYHCFFQLVIRISQPSTVYNRTPKIK